MKIMCEVACKEGLQVGNNDSPWGPTLSLGQTRRKNQDGAAGVLLRTLFPYIRQWLSEPYGSLTSNPFFPFLLQFKKWLPGEKISMDTVALQGRKERSHLQRI